MGQLAHTVPLGLREPAFSFLSRLAARNTTDTADFALDMGLGFGNVIAGKPETLKALADLAQISFEDLQAWTPIYVSARQHSFRGEMFHTRGLHSTTIYGCPACLREDAQTNGSVDAMAIRAHWLVHHITCCMDHGLPLVKLWAKTVPHQRHDTASRLREISPAILSGALDPQPREIDPFDRWIHARLDGKRTDSWLDQFDLHPAAHFCELLGRAAYATKVQKSLKFTYQQLFLSTGVGFNLASPGEANVRNAFYGLQCTIGTAHDGPKKKFGDLYDRLASNLLGPGYAPFRNLLRDHIATTWPLGPGDTLMGEPVLERRNHSVLTAARETAIHPGRLRELLIKAEFLKPSETVHDDAWDIFDAKASARFLASLNPHVSTTELKNSLCIERSLFDSLRNDGYFVPLFDGTKHKPLWDRIACQKRFDALMCGAELMYVAKPYWCGLSVAAQRLKISPNEILAMIEDGRLTRIGKLQGYEGFSALLIPLKEAVQAFERSEAVSDN